MSTPVGTRTGILWDDIELTRLVSAATAGTSGSLQATILSHLATPSTAAVRLAADLEVDLGMVRAAYRHCRTSIAVHDLVNSNYYPHRLRWAAAASTITEWQRNPDRPALIAAHEPAMSETVEIHPTRGTCNYSCAMCLWSDQKELTYTTQFLDAGGLLSAHEWIRVLGDLRDGGVRRVVISGGGEALINPELPDILTAAADLGFDIHVYTTGFSIRSGTPLFAALLRCHRIRFSIHSPDPITYDRIAGTRPQQRALHRVVENLAALRTARSDGLRLGMGCVIQPFNIEQITEMAAFAANAEADWLDLRKDEVEVTNSLDGMQTARLREQLRALRAAPPAGTRIDLGDELVAIANGSTPQRARTRECMARYLRPTISPYGLLAPCDLKAEPRFAQGGYDLGNIKRSRILDVVTTSAQRPIADDCDQCMPSSRTGNAVVHKLLDDLAAGLTLDEQPFSYAPAGP
ncbi:radical SAM protein [Nocardia sp. NBC_01329]|uniref:radical SAM protein n=1 Tax=Nocardia sp. NBC_01329 TaxID=2903594 RepID=UPI002E0DFC47|nr:radical SAM protein [Nocardia sp. NBC_01329]